MCRVFSNNAIGYLEDDLPRMVKTPWSDEEMPFGEAAEIGTKKVIQDILQLVFSYNRWKFSGISRDDYILAEERVVKELKEINKPFVIVLNTVAPYSDYSRDLANSLEEKYNCPVIPQTVLIYLYMILMKFLAKYYMNFH